MIRVLAILAILFVLTAGAAFLADHPGVVRYDWFGATGELSTSEALVVVLAAFVAVIFILELLRAGFRAPRRILKRAEARRREKSWQALSDGLVAIAAGDAAGAARATAIARRIAPDEKLTALLAAQTAQLSGEPGLAQERFLAMTHNPATLTLGLRGLSIEAARAGDHAAARAHARAANAADPSLPWAAAAAFDAATADRDWPGALALNDGALRHKLVDAALHRRRKAVLLMARAEDMLATNPEAARRDAVEAHQLARNLVPAALLAARLSAPRARRQAAAIPEETYRIAPHPDLFAVALDLAESQSAADRLKRAETLAATQPRHLESALGLARAALSAREFARARAALAPFAERPTQRVAVLMAEIEAADTADEGRVREWLARAVRAARDPAWIADGIISDHWQPTSPVTGALDRFVWAVPDGGADVAPPIDLAALVPARLKPPEEARPLPGPSVPGARPWGGEN
ncbi:heme biosynthesis protein HemY [Acuticoccus kandeliae]|uniref:heme biosynthesis protein HemY n=1 Tax=Acuticoccus kandeliae TaxID=2073160 RepID=UPI000D3EDB76|nr:heme biosynthesis HemY N-terminal domain-containing protein [Acuticoccus kandeliae]